MSAQVDEVDPGKSVGSLLDYMIRRIFAKHNIYSEIADLDSKSSIDKKLKRFLIPKKLSDHVTRVDLESGEGSLYDVGIEPSFRKQYLKAYRSYLETYSFNSFILSMQKDDSGGIVAAYAALLPVIYLSMLGKAAAVENASSAFELSVPGTKPIVLFSKVFEPQALEILRAEHVSEMKKNRLLQILLYYVSFYKLDV